MDYEKWLIKDYEHWGVYLHENQYYLGRCYIWAKRENALDFFDMSQEEQEEYFNIGRELKDVLNNLFNPDLYNYATLANVSPHLHTHVIPRYKDKRELSEITFVDGRWSKNYAPYNKDFKVPEDTLIKIRDLISKELSKQ